MARSDGEKQRQARIWLDELSKSETATPRWQEAVEALASLGSAVADPLVESLAEDNLSVKRGAGQALKRIGPAIIPHLIRALQHPNASIRSTAATLLYGFGNDALEALPELTDALKDRDKFVRQWAATALERLAFDLGPAIKTAVPNLIETLQDEDYMVREWSAHALGTIGADASEAVPFLELAMVDDVPSVREAAIEALNKISPPQWTGECDA